MGGRITQKDRDDTGVPFTPAPSTVAGASSPVGASGLRPAFAFVGMAAIFLLLVGRSFWLQAFASGEQPDVRAVREAPTPGFTILDREGRALALSVECFDVTVSPRAMWRSHTPARMAEKIAAILDESFGRAARTDDHETDFDPSGSQSSEELWTPGRVLERAMPEELAGGALPWRLVPEDPALLVLEGQRVQAVRAWLDTGAIEGADDPREPGPPIRGLGLVPIEVGDANGEPAWTLAMEPVACLGREARIDRFGQWKSASGALETAPPERWTRRLLTDLVALIGRDVLESRLGPIAREAFDALPRTEKSEALRDALWAEIMPSRFRVVARSIDPTRAHALRELMAEESVSSFQLQLVPRVERRHPTRPGGEPVAPSIDAGSSRAAAGAPDPRGNDAFALLGHWGTLDEDRAQMRAERDRRSRPHVLPWADATDPFETYRESLVHDRQPWSGIELLCRTELEDGEWAPLAGAVRGRAYERFVRHVARDRKRAWRRGVPDYYSSIDDGTDVPEVVVTLDARLQEVLHAELGTLMEEHGPALAMGVVVDVPSGEVLALDARSMYGYSGYAPLLHEFTPGSTFKAVIMALALDAGITTPDETFKTYFDERFFLGKREIGEAEGAPTEPYITAAQGLAMSCNAVLVQIALRFEASDLRERILSLGYDAAPGAGLGTERSGRVPALERGTWKRDYTHASVGFGHELTVTLWQHAEALATILRGGVRRPLTLLRRFERNGESWRHEPGEAERVLSERACEDVRAMLSLGAEEGTGRHVARRDQHPELDWIGTKTGTTEKVPSELCVHLELEALADVARTRSKWTKAMRRALLERPRPHRRSSCYTSSMCAAASAIVDGERREVMVLIVADGPTGPERFGSKVTGPTTIAVLRQALGFPREAGADREELAREIEQNEQTSPDDSDLPPLFGGADETLPWRDALRRRGEFDVDWLDDVRPWAPGSESSAEREERR